MHNERRTTNGVRTKQTASPQPACAGHTADFRGGGSEQQGAVPAEERRWDRRGKKRPDGGGGRRKHAQPHLDRHGQVGKPNRICLGRRPGDGIGGARLRSALAGTALARLARAAGAGGLSSSAIRRARQPGGRPWRNTQRRLGPDDQAAQQDGEGGAHDGSYVWYRPEAPGD